MALEFANITFDLSDQLGVDFDPRRTKVWITTNVPNDTVIDQTGNKIRLGSGNVTVNPDGTGQIDVWKVGQTGLNPLSWQTTVHVDYPDRNERGGRGRRDFGPFTIASSGDLAVLVAEQEVPPTYVSQVTAQLDAKVTEASGYADDAAASAAQAQSVADIDTPDALVATLVPTSSGSATSAALSATIGTEVAVKTISGQRMMKSPRNPTFVISRQLPHPTGANYVPLWGVSDLVYARYDDPSRGPSLMRSQDGGSNYLRRGSIPAGIVAGRFWRLVDGTVLVMDTSATPKFYRTTNDGATAWTQVHTLRAEEGVLGGFCEDLKTGYVYFGVYYTSYGGVGTTTYPTVRLYRSTDKGVTWTVFYEFASRHAGGAGAIDHIHSVEYDPVSQRVYISTGDGNTAAGIYRVTADGTSVEPVILNSQIGGDKARAIGFMFFDTHIAWNVDSSDAGIFRLPRTAIGAPNVGAQAERVFTMNGSGYYTAKANAAGTRWLCSATSLNGIDQLVHLYAVEDNGATVYEVGAWTQYNSNTSAQVHVGTLGSPTLQGDNSVWLRGVQFEGGEWAVRGTLGYSTNPLPRPGLRPDPIDPPPPYPLATTGEHNVPIPLVKDDVVMPNKAWRGFGFIATRTETIGKVRVRTGATAAVGLNSGRIGIYKADPTAATLTLVAETGPLTGTWSAADTLYTHNLTTSWVKERGGMYAIGLWVDATTPPSFFGWKSSLGSMPPGADSQRPFFCLSVPSEGSQTGLPADGSFLRWGQGGPCVFALP